MSNLILIHRHSAETLIDWFRFVTILLIDIFCVYVTLSINAIMKPAAKPRFFNARINESGRIVIPAAIREQMGLKPGEAVVMELEDGILRIESHRAHIRRIQQEFKRPVEPGQKLASQQLIEDRQEETTHEMEEWLG